MPTESDPKKASPEEDLSLDWQTLRGNNIPEEPPSFPDRNKGDFVLGTNTGRIILRITAQGKVQLGPGVDLDEAAELFWTNLALKRLGMEERLMHLGVMERIFMQLGEADLAYERSQLRANKAEATDHDKMMVELSRRSLEARVHGVIEFARALLRRPEPLTDESENDPVPPTPPVR